MSILCSEWVCLRLGFIKSKIYQNWEKTSTSKNLHTKIQVITWNHFIERQLKNKSQNTYSYKSSSLVFMLALRFILPPPPPISRALVVLMNERIVTFKATGIQTLVRILCNTFVDHNKIPCRHFNSQCWRETSYGFPILNPEISQFFT